MKLFWTNLFALGIVCPVLAMRKHTQDFLTTNSLVESPSPDSSYTSQAEYIMGKIREGPDFKQISDAFSKMMDTAMTHFYDHFLPALSRARRDTRDENEGYYMDAIVTGFGAIMDSQDCRSRVTCNAGKVIRSNMPGAQVAVLLVESVMPTKW